ncbi:hypothetical protein QCD71_19085 [Sphingomonas sp. PsM26]|nr:hypothetical protein [Sphingomonas sp. PsM26]
MRRAAHELIGHPDDVNYASAALVSTDFLKAYVLGDRQALAKLNTGKDAKGAVWLKR